MKDHIEELVSEIETVLGETNFEKATSEVNESYFDGLSYAYGHTIKILKKSVTTSSGTTLQLMKIPCKVGDVLYNAEGTKLEVTKICIILEKSDTDLMYIRCIDENGNYYRYDFKEFGVRLFYSLEEATKAVFE